ncbi:hypothetical protein PYCC9005_004486 [Savitreella phatthalungensis]
MAKEPTWPAPVPSFPEVSGVDCEDCDGCVLSPDGHAYVFDGYDDALVKSLDLETEMYGGIQPFHAHVCIATGVDDWAHTIEDVARTPAKVIAGALDTRKTDLEPLDRIVLSNTSATPPDTSHMHITILSSHWARIRCLPSQADALASYIIDPTAVGDLEIERLPYSAVVLICSHSRRDARCGKTAPLLRDAFEEVLRDRELYYDADEGGEEGKVRVEMCSHIGGHKFAGNVLIYRTRTDHPPNPSRESVWCGRVMPKHVPLLVDHTIIAGKVLRPLVRGGMRW